MIDNWYNVHIEVKEVTMKSASSETMLPPTATVAHIDTALKDEDWRVRVAAIEHPNATSAHIDTALKDVHWEVRQSAIEHPNATSDHISAALKDSNSYVRRAAQIAQEKLQK